MNTSQKNRRAARQRRQNIVAILQLIFCFPLGIYNMWTRMKWHKAVKVAVSGVVALVLAAIMLPMTNPPERATGGIRLVGSSPSVEVMGPEAPEDREIVEIYAPRRTAIIVEATPTPAPVYVYCNAGGQYYHAHECKWVTETTPQVTLTQALNAGYRPCPECDAPAPIGG